MPPPAAAGRQQKTQRKTAVPAVPKNPLPSRTHVVESRKRVLGLRGKALAEASNSAGPSRWNRTTNSGFIHVHGMWLRHPSRPSLFFKMSTSAHSLAVVKGAALRIQAAVRACFARRYVRALRQLDEASASAGDRPSPPPAPPADLPASIISQTRALVNAKLRVEAAGRSMRQQAAALRTEASVLYALTVPPNAKTGARPAPSLGAGGRYSRRPSAAATAVSSTSGADHDGGRRRSRAHSVARSVGGGDLLPVTDLGSAREGLLAGCSVEAAVENADVDSAVVEALGDVTPASPPVAGVDANDALDAALDREIAALEAAADELAAERAKLDFDGERERAAAVRRAELWVEWQKERANR